MKLKIFYLFFFFSISLTAYSSSIRVIEMQSLIDNNQILKKLYLLIESDQNIYLKKFKNEELQLEVKLSEINQLKLILSDEELKNEITNYNELLSNFNTKIEVFNLHYDNQINNLKNIIINNILILLKQYSIDNKIELILDANNYILSSNSINITELISQKLNITDIEFKFEKYK